MTASSQAAAATARNDSQPTRNWPQIVLRRLAQTPLKQLADALNRDDSTVSRIRSGEARMTFNEFCTLLTALDQKVVDADAICVNREKFAALATIAQAAMADEQTARRLIWEDQ